MAGLLSNFRNTMILSFVLSIIMVAGYMSHYGSADAIFWQAVFRWLHTFFGILWIGLLYYFNFVQIRIMPSIPAELKPGVSKYIAPEALFWFRWAAVATWVMGVILAFNRGYLIDAFALGATTGNPQHTFIGTGMWLATIMFFNVWVFIWPNQKIALGLVEADADAKAKAARMAMLFSRTNTLLSVPMLVTMTMSQTIFG
ncbi:urate hydroxylase PuuD [Phenylobacterium sp.]|uniref:urate hydroxylase PuuD n=1 Tax=Phenylobacterium sp. TaxID=1871053 RepID=UPI00286BCF0A|nr:urate hydroxylase PuuD [Phenylobacterium sp.]